MPGESGVTVVTNSRVFYTPREAAGASGARHSLRPLIREGGTFPAKLGRNAPRDREAVSAPQLSSPAKAGDPVFQRRQRLNRKPQRTGYPAFAGYDGCHVGGRLRTTNAAEGRSGHRPATQRKTASRYDPSTGRNGVRSSGSGGEANLARFKRPQLIKFVDALPRNATGKIHKPTLRKNFGSPKMIDINQVAS
jgi:hypothetical protein